MQVLWEVTRYLKMTEESGAAVLVMELVALVELQGTRVKRVRRQPVPADAITGEIALIDSLIEAGDRAVPTTDSRGRPGVLVIRADGTKEWFDLSRVDRS